MRYAFSLPDNNGLDPADPLYAEYDYVAGDYLDVQLPYAVSFEEPTGGWNVLDESNNVMGSLTIDSGGQARITFTNYVETHSSIRGWFSLEGSFKDGIFDGGDPVQIDVVFAGTTVRIGFLEDEDELSVSADKSGTYETAANRITWRFTVTPSQAVDSLKIVDTFSNNQTYVAGSFLKGTTTIPDSALSIVAGASTTTITYDNVSLGGATTFTYQTEPTSTAFTARDGQRGKTSFSSNGVDIFKDDDPLADDDANVSINWVQKSGSVVGTSAADSRLIRWTVTVDSGGYDITGCTLTDTIPKDLELFVDATHPVRFGSTNLTEASGGAANTYTYAAGTDGAHILTLYLDTVTNSGSLTFYTRVTDEAYYKVNGSTTMTNRIEMDWNENYSGNPSDSAGGKRGSGAPLQDGGGAP